MGSNPATIATIATGGFLLAPSVYQAEEANKARRQSQDEAGKQADQFRKLQGDLAAQQEATLGTQAADAARRAARRRQIGAYAGATGRQDTILTQGLGTVGAAPGAQKTLLGQ